MRRANTIDADLVGADIDGPERSCGEDGGLGQSRGRIHGGHFVGVSAPGQRPEPLARTPVKESGRTSPRPDVAAQMIDQYEAGATLREIAEEFGVRRATVSRNLKKAGVQLRRGGLDGRTAASCRRTLRERYDAR